MNTTRPHHATARPRDNALLRRAEANDTSTLICCRALAHGPTKAQRAAPRFGDAAMQRSARVGSFVTGARTKIPAARVWLVEGKRSKAGGDPPA